MWDLIKKVQFYVLKQVRDFVYNEIALGECKHKTEVDRGSYGPNMWPLNPEAARVITIQPLPLRHHWMKTGSEGC